MRKNARLSFRISDSLSKRIQNAIDNSGEQIRDRSDFGTKAVLFYLDYIENIQSEKELILNALVSLAEEVEVTTPEISEIQKLLDKKTMIPSTISSTKTPESHKDFEKLLELRDKLDPNRQEELTEEMRDATYQDIGTIYKEYREQYLKEGNKLGQKLEKVEN